MPSYFTSATGTRYTVPTHNVYTRARWDGPWVLQDDLFCTELTFGVSPDRDTAILTRVYGRQVPRGKQIVETIKPIDISGHWIKIEITADPTDKMIDQFGFLTWVGQEAGSSENQGGAFDKERLDTDTRRSGIPDPVPDDVTVVTLETGQQFWTVFGFDALLNQILIVSSVVEAQANEKPFHIQRALIFNDPKLDGDPLTNGPGNRSTLRGPQGVFIFADPKKAVVTHWTSRDIIEYLLVYHRPIDKADINSLEKKGEPITFGNIPMKWDRTEIKKIVPNFDRPIRNFHGTSVTKALDQMLARKRGLGWKANTYEIEGATPLPANPTEAETATFQAQRDQQLTIVLTPFSFLKEPIQLDSTRILKENSNQESVTVNDKKSVGLLIVKKSTARQYQRIKAVGRRIRSTFSLSDTDETLEGVWGSNDPNLYSKSLSEKNNYPTRRDQKQKIDAEFRKSEQFSDLWAVFRIPNDWNGLTGVSDVTKPNNLVTQNAIVNSKGKPGKFYRGSLRLLSHIPIKQNMERIAEGKRAAFALINVGGTALTGAGTAFDDLPESQRPPYYIPIDDLNSASGLEKDNRGAAKYDWSGNLSIDKRDAAVKIRVTGEPKHVMGDDQFAKLDHDDKEVELSWEKLIITVQAELDEHVESIFPTAAALDGQLDLIKTLRVDMGDEYGLDYVTNFTVTGVEDGRLILAIGHFVRDDREKLAEIARQAFLWWSRERISVEWDIRELFNPVVLGGYIIAFGPFSDDWVDETTIESVVTRIRINLEQKPPIVTTTTSYAELDFGHISRQFRQTPK